MNQSKCFSCVFAAGAIFCGFEVAFHAMIFGLNNEKYLGKRHGEDAKTLTDSPFVAPFFEEHFLCAAF